ncbi:MULTISPECIES: phosphatase PAP2 family protein [Priestia]|uniref:phosphatase PAP2 family protein n=1 Tax=Priestia TaxID=2800373 RepID=UPI00104D013A|nr:MULTISPECIES: phosphatase PAP2 family protein [Priestia]MBX9996891.1 phosphatase PAP2 family protein [Priestia aryabhattai]MCM3155343.1 phosphatase PAP2 family protein [Priestia megaterium]TCN04443.1 PAP2 superfamily protein [Bacillus sp. BK006]
MNFKIQFLVAFISSLYLIIFVDMIFILIRGETFIHINSIILSYIQHLKFPMFKRTMKVFMFLGSTPFIITLSVGSLVLFYRIFKYRTELILFLGITSGSFILNKIQKMFYSFGRPDLHHLIKISGYSLQHDGEHTVSLVIVYGILLLQLWNLGSRLWGRFLLVCIGSVVILGIGISRIYFGFNYPSNIMGSYFTMGCWLVVAVSFYWRWKERHEKQKVINEGRV